MKSSSSERALGKRRETCAIVDADAKAVRSRTTIDHVVANVALAQEIQARGGVVPGTLLTGLSSDHVVLHVCAPLAPVRAPPPAKQPKVNLAALGA